MGLIPWRNKQTEGGGETSPLRTLRAEMDRLLDAYVREPFATMDWPLVGQRHWMPTVDVAENDAEFVVRAELAGVRPEEMEITISGNYLVLAGEKKESSEKSGKDFYQMESRFGSFRRTIPLPQTVDPDKVEAEYENGVLVVRLQKSPAVPAKRVAVKVKE